MRNVTCADCRKRYDFDKDDFCPKCGAFNPPKVQPQPQTTSTPTHPSHSLPQRKTPHYSGGHTTLESRNRQDTRQLGAPPSKRSGLAVVTVIAVLVMMPLLISIIRTFVELEPAPIPDGLPGFEAHALYDEFQVNDVTVSIDGCQWLELPEGSKYNREGYACLTVDVWVTGGQPREDLRIDIPCIALADGTQIPLEDDILLTRDLKDYGVTVVTLSDYQWEDPLYGQFVFFVPEDAGDQLTLRICEYGRGTVKEARLATVHDVTLELVA